jgi:hypothetical protein
MMAKLPKKLKWYQQTKWAAALVPLCLLGCYLMVSLALNSASLIQYGVAIALLVLAINRATHVVFMLTGHGRVG